MKTPLRYQQVVEIGKGNDCRERENYLAQSRRSLDDLLRRRGIVSSLIVFGAI